MARARGRGEGLPGPVVPAAMAEAEVETSRMTKSSAIIRQLRLRLERGGGQSLQGAVADGSTAAASRAAAARPPWVELARAARHRGFFLS